MNSVFRNWSDVRIFLAVVRAGSTLAASKLLDVAQPTVARRIDALEHELGLILFDRDTRGFSPTDATRTLLPAAEALEAAAAELAKKAAEMKKVRPIRLTAFTANLSQSTIDILGEFTELNPDVEFEFLPSVQVLDLMKGEADVALRISHARQHPDLICRHVSHARFTVFGAPSYAKKYGLPCSPAEMKDHSLMAFLRPDVPPRFHDWLVRMGGKDAIKRTFHEISLLDTAIRAGLGLGIINIRLVAPEIEAGTLISCFDAPEELTAAHQVIISPEAYRRPEVRAFTKFFTPRYAKLYK
ncbi:MAG: DNA-binding transcriptional LysR family regulator [Yoonia sp.]|jgi:DNA-binding transcriptional LysR family regulator